MTVINTRWVARVVGALLMLMSVAPGLSLAQTGAKQFNYYSNDSRAKHRIQVVEQYHWRPALQCMQSNRFGCAQKELQFILTWVPNHPNALIKYSELAIRMEDPKQAETHFDNAARFAPTDPMVPMLYGIHLHRSGDTAGAIKQDEKAVAADPSLSEAHYNLGLAYLESGKLEKANEHAQKAYGLGYPLPGLRSQLKKAGAWKALPETADASTQ